MMSHPLPNHILLPTSIKHFLTLLTNALYSSNSNEINHRTRSQSTFNLQALYTLMHAHPNTVPQFLHATQQRTIHATLSKCLINPDSHIKFLTIACIAKIAQCETFDGSQDHPQSLFEGVKGAKVVKLAISTVLSAVTSPTENRAEIIRLCSVAISAINAGLIDEWIEQRGSGQQLIKLREKADGNMDEEMLQAVFTPP